MMRGHETGPAIAANRLNSRRHLSWACSNARQILSQPSCPIVETLYLRIDSFSAQCLMVFKEYPREKMAMFGLRLYL